MPNVLCKWMWNHMWNCTSKWISFECVIKCQIYYENECGTKYKIVHQSKLNLNV